MRFDWRQYVHISRDFSSAERALIAQALNGIAHAHDGEGAQLIRAAAIHHKPIIIEKNDVTAGRIIDRQFHLGVNLEAVAQMVCTPHNMIAAGIPKAARHLSLTGVLVHELYHGGDRLTDKQPLYDKSHRFLLPLLQQHGVPHARATLWKFLSMYDRYDPTYPYLLMTNRFLNRDETIAAFKTHGYADVARMLEAVPTDEFDAALKRAGLLDSEGVPRWEADAVAYTDAFMWKNVGRAEPQCHSYANIALVEAHGLPRSLQIDTHAHPGPGFIADAAPALQATLPRVRPVGGHVRK